MKRILNTRARECPLISAERPQSGTPRDSACLCSRCSVADCVSDLLRLLRPSLREAEVKQQRRTGRGTTKRWME
jgi:hypothetical protein